MSDTYPAGTLLRLARPCPELGEGGEEVHLRRMRDDDLTDAWSDWRAWAPTSFDLAELRSYGWAVTPIAPPRPAWTQELGAVGVDPMGDVWRRNRFSEIDTWYRIGVPQPCDYADIPQPLTRLVPAVEP